MDHPLPPGALCAEHPDRPAAAACQRCGAFSCVECISSDGAQWICAACRAAGLRDRRRTAWERRDELGLGNALWETFREVWKEPEAVGRGLDPRGPVLDLWRMLYLMLLPAAVMNSFVGLGFSTLIQQFSGPQPELDGILGQLQNPLWNFLIGITVGPALAPFGHMVVGSLDHVFLLLVGAGRQGLRATVRGCCYASTLNAIGAIPLAGMIAPLLVLIWKIRLYATLHQTTTTRTALAVLALPCVAICGVAVFVGLLAAGLAAMLKGSGAF